MGLEYNPMIGIPDRFDEASSNQYATGIIEESTSDSPILDSLVSAANVVNKIFNASTCARFMCQVYTEKQLEFEIRQDRLIQSSTSNEQCIPLTSSEDSGCTHSSNSPVDRAYMKCASSVGATQPENAFQIQLYRQFLFDEESVVDTVRNRTSDDE